MGIQHKRAVGSHSTAMLVGTALTALLCGCVEGAEARSPVFKETRVISLDEATNHALVRPLPLNVSVPKGYKRFPDEPSR